MKKIILFAVIGFLATSLQAQPPKIDAKSGMKFGKEFNPAEAVAADKLSTIVVTDKPTGLMVKGKVTEVCKAEGCWIKIQTEEGPVLVKMKDHAFVVPLSLAGMNVIIKGTGKIQETSVERLRHYAEDAGKSKEEIEAIKDPKREIVLQAEGLIVE